MEEIEKLKLENEELQLENTRLTGTLHEIKEDMYRDWQAGEFIWTTIFAGFQILIVWLFITPLVMAGIYNGPHGAVGKALLNIGFIIALAYLYVFAFWYWLTRMCETVFKDEIRTTVRRINIAFRGAVGGALKATREERRRERDEL